jgi:hypothetical protein
MMIVSLKYTDVSEVRTTSIIIILNRRSTSTRLYGTKSQKAVIFTLDTVRTWKLTKERSIDVGSQCLITRQASPMFCLRSEDTFVITCVANLTEVKALYVQQYLRYEISSYWRFNVILDGIITLTKAFLPGEGAWVLKWLLELCQRELQLLVGSPKPDRSKEMSQTKNDTLVLQVGGWAWG